MHFDFSSLSLVDCHAHPFMPSREKKVYGRRYILSSDKYMQVPQEDISSTLSYRMILIELARYLKVDENSSDALILNARQKLVSQGYREYVEGLFDDARITTYLNETGFPIQGERLRSDEVYCFQSATNRIDVREIIRLEMTCNQIVTDAEEKLGFDDFLRLFRVNISERIKKGKIVALKTVIGYFSGLEILEPEYKAAKESFELYYYKVNNNLSITQTRSIQKAYRDYMVFECVNLCKEFGIPLQIHTGAGDPPSCDLRLMHPSLLYEFLSRADVSLIPISLLHGGYPFSDEMTFLVNGYSNVFTDVSSMTADDSIAVERILPMLLEKIPLTKIMYGSDGAGDVDPIWFAAVNFKKVLGRIFDSLVSRKVMTYSFGEDAAPMILSKNAIKFYKL